LVFFKVEKELHGSKIDVVLSEEGGQSITRDR
jgi:hypothetical protein